MKDLFFFTTRNDLEPIIKDIEAQHQLKYVPLEIRESPGFITYHSLFEHPDVSIIKEPDLICQNFFIFPRNQNIEIETLTAPNGRISYEVTFSVNPSTVRLVPCGIYQNHKTIFCGKVSPTKKPSYSLSQDLIIVFQDMLQRMNVKKINPVFVYPGYHYYIGAEAASLVRQEGYRLVHTNPCLVEEFLRTPGVF
jgi:hypothetical protein